MIKNTKIRKILNILVILISICLILEMFQRARRAYLTKDMSWVYYGFKMPKSVVPVNTIENIFFRKPYKIFRKGEGRNVLFMGGSSTYGAYNDNFHTFPYLLQAKLDNISCLNLGRSSLTSDGYMGFLKRCCEEYCIPDMVIFYTGYNDMFIKSFNLKNRKFYNNKFIQKLERYSFLLVSFREKIMIREQIQKRKNPEYRKRFVVEFKNNIEECLKYANSKNIKVVLIPEVLAAEKFSSSITNDYRWYKDVYVDIVPALKELSQRYNCYFLDPRDELYADWKENFMDPVHLTDKGNEAMSGFLLQRLSLSGGE